jgi:outer membrane protein assembly factor BamB
VLIAGVLLGGMLLARWRAGDDMPAVTRRVALPGEGSSDGGQPAVASPVVKIGEFFTNFTGVASASAGAWPCFRGSNFDNIAVGDKLADAWPAAGPPVLWSVPLGEGYAGPAVMNGCVYLLDYDGERDADSLRCFSLDDGREIWRRWYRVNIKRNHGMSRTVPSATARHVVTIGPRCHVMCVDATSGALRWGIDLERDWGTTVPMWYTGQCPLIDDGQVILAAAGTALMMGVDLETGKVLWQTPNARKWQMSHSSVMPMTLAGKKMYVYCAVGGMAGVSAEPADRGALLWEATEWNHQVVAPAPVPIGDDRILVTAGYGEGSAIFKVTDAAGVFNVKQVRKLDKQVFACEQHTPIFYKGYLYSVLPADAGSTKRQAVCMSPDAVIAWTSGGTERFGLGPYIVADDKLFILDDNGVLTMIRPDGTGYNKLAQAKVLQGKEAWAPMAVADGRLLVRDYGMMKCLDMRVGK